MTKPSSHKTSNKRPHSTEESEVEEESEEGWYEVEDILDQKGNQFFVSWVGNDPVTGQRYEPSWVNRSFFPKKPRA